MKLSVYLMRDSIKKFDEILNDKSLKGSKPFRELKSSTTMPYPCKAFIQVNKSGAPKWESFLRGAFRTSNLNLVNQNSSFVLLIKKQNRFFAVTLGFGFLAIDPTAIESRFGLMVAANWLTKVNGVETNIIDRVSRSQKLHLGEGSDFAELSLNPQIDFIRRMEGKLPTNATATKISGCDSCCITTKGDITSLGAICTDLLERYEAKDYKKLYGFLDNLMPLGKHDPRIPELEEKLAKRLAAKSYEKISIAFPEIPDEERLNHYKVSCGISVDLEELTLEGIYEFIKDYGIEANPDKIFVLGIGNDDSPVTRRRSLREYLAAEFEKGSDTFIFCNGDWFLAEANYVKKVRKEVAALPDVTLSLALAPMKSNESEGAYNERASMANDLLLMDKDNFRIGGSHDKIEVCDLLSETHELICVKKMESSSSMSHLFAQGSVSATLLRSEAAYRNNLNTSGTAEWRTFKAVDDNNITGVTVVYGIATRKTKPLSEGMFFFSLVNLLNHVRTIKLTGCKVALCKIEYEGAPSSPTKSKRKKRATKAVKSKTT